MSHHHSKPLKKGYSRRHADENLDPESSTKNKNPATKASRNDVGVAPSTQMNSLDTGLNWGASMLIFDGKFVDDHLYKLDLSGAQGEFIENRSNT